MYSTLIDKMSSPKWCVSAWKQNFVDRPSDMHETSQTTTQKTCVERWEMPCGRPTTIGYSFISSPSTTFRPLEGRRLISAITMINETVQYVAVNTVSLQLARLLFYLHKNICQAHRSAVPKLLLGRGQIRVQREVGCRIIVAHETKFRGAHK